MKYDRIEIHFRTKDNEPRMVIIDRETDVGLIRLENVDPETKPPVARGLHIVGRVAPEQRAGVWENNTKLKILR